MNDKSQLIGPLTVRLDHRNKPYRQSSLHRDIPKRRSFASWAFPILGLQSASSAHLRISPTRMWTVSHSDDVGVDQRTGCLRFHYRSRLRLCCVYHRLCFGTLDFRFVDSLLPLHQLNSALVPEDQRELVA